MTSLPETSSFLEGAGPFEVPHRVGTEGGNMSNLADQEQIESNLRIIRAYLQNKFPNYTIREVSGLNVYYMFIVTNVELYQTYILRIDAPRLSDQNRAPTKTQAELNSYDIATRMIEANGDYFYWK